jgi:O-antigen/teichoic acid export membrane protein
MGAADRMPDERSAGTDRVGARTLRTARGLAALGVGEIVGKAATLLLIIVAARALGPADFGVFAFALALGTLVAIVPSWGFDTLVVQRGSRRPEQLPTLLAELLTVRIAIAVPVLLVVGGVELVHRGWGVAGWASVLVLLACMLDVGADGFRSVATARERQGRCAVVQIIQRLTGAGLVVLAVSTGGGLLAVSAGYTTGSLIGMIGMGFAVRRIGIAPAWSLVTRKGVRQLRRDSQVMGVHAVVSMALLRLGAVLLGVFAGDVAVGVYSAAYRLLETVLFIPWTVSRVLYPVMAATPSPEHIRRAVDRGVAVLSAAFLPYAVVLLLRGEELLRLLYGQAFAVQGAAILYWLAAAPLLFGIANMAGDVLLARGPNGRLLIGSCAALGTSTVLTLALIPALGAVSAALATTAAYFVEALVLGVFAYREAGPLIRFRSLLSSLAATTLAAAALLAPMPLIPAVLLATIVFALGWWTVTKRLDPEQVLVLRTMLVRAPPSEKR